MMNRTVLLAFLATTLLPGCIDGNGMAVSSADIPLGDVDACEAAVARQTNNPEVRTLSTSSSEAANTVTVGVGPDAAPWRCLVKGGIVSDVMSMTDEGAL